jgi:SAM-dependent methyltransferase
MTASEALERIKQESEERLNPSITNPNWLVLRERRKLFQSWLAALPQQALSVLDIGGRLQPYRPLFEGRCQRYVAIDLRKSPLVDVMARGEQLPLKDDQFDVVLCTQMLEYVPEPSQVTREIHRVLKPGAVLLLSVPAIFPTDSEEDLWRFTPGSLRLLLGTFRNVEIRAEGSSIHGLFRTIAIWVACFARPAALATLLKFTLVPLLNVSAVCFAGAVPTTNDQFAPNFSVLARK